MLQAVRLLTEMARTSDDRSREDSESNIDAQPSSTTNEYLPVLFREIQKNGWLRRTETGHKPDKDTSRCWVAFCIHDDVEPRFEGFADQKQANSHVPLWTQSLRNVLHLSPTLCATSKNDYEFCVNFSNDRILRLAAPTYQAMLDWVQVVTRKLTDMKILPPKENLYSRGPERIATRDPTSPLPPPPSLGALSARTISSSFPPSTSTAPTVFTFDDIVAEERRAFGRQVTRAAPVIPPSPRLLSAASFVPVAAPASASAAALASTVASASASASAAAAAAALAVTTSPPMGVATTTNNVSHDNNSNYESVFLASSYAHAGEHARVSSASTSRSQSSSDEGEQYAVLIDCRSSDNVETEPGYGSTAVSVTQGRQMRTLLTMREQQVMQLRKEMSHPAGVRLKLGRRDCKDGIAFVDCFSAVWVAGWKYKEHPLLYNVLHVGDLVLSVAGIPLNGANSVKEILKNYTFPRVEMIVRRLPHGLVTTLTRHSESEDFGLQVGSVNEILSVSASAQALGLSSVANPADPGADVGTIVNWILTEVNNRPVNLYEGCARERLNALGRDVSVVMQPSDLVNAIKKKLRAVRNYKSYILQ